MPTTAEQQPTALNSDAMCCTGPLSTYPQSTTLAGLGWIDLAARLPDYHQQPMRGLGRTVETLDIGEFRRQQRRWRWAFRRELWRQTNWRTRLNLWWYEVTLWPRLAWYIAIDTIRPRRSGRDD